MARFRCPSTIYEEDADPEEAQRILTDMTTTLVPHPRAGPSRGRKKRDRRPRDQSFTDQRRKVEMARKVEGRRSQNVKLKSNHVYVGNLSPGTSEQTLRTFFQSVCCANIVHLSIRCAMGFAETENGIRRQSFYAVIAFDQANAVGIALSLSGQACDGRKLIVSRNPLDMPEMDATFAPHNNRASIQPIKLEPTVMNLDDAALVPLLPPRCQAGAARNVFMGLSFGKSVV